MSALYDQVAALDQGIADRWKARTRDNAGHKLTPGDIDAIMSPMLKKSGLQRGTTRITEKQAEAIVTLARTTNFDKGGLDRLKYWVQLAQDSFALDLTPLLTDDELRPIYRALAIAASFSFASPGTKVNYAPHHYVGIAELAKQRKINVYQAQMSDLGVLTSIEGIYYSDRNILIVYDKPGTARFTAVVVHETTHAVQDWLDVKTQRRFSEADAYIAQAATMDTPMFSGDLSATAFRASRFILNRRALVSNKDWTDAYGKVVKAYESTHTDGGDLQTNKASGESELAQYQSILDAVDKRAREIRDSAADALDSAASQIAHELGQLIP